MTDEAGVGCSAQAMPLALLTVQVDALTPCQQCSTCKFLKPLSDFHSGSVDECSDCAGRGTKRPREDDQAPPPSLKACTKCQEPKPKSEFYRNMARQDGLHPICKPCHNANIAANRSKKKQKRPSVSPQRRSTRERKQPTWARNMVLGDAPLEEEGTTETDTDIDEVDISDADALLAHAALAALQQGMMPPAAQPDDGATGAPLVEPSHEPAAAAAAVPSARDKPPGKPPLPTKRCRSCGVELPSSMFYITKVNTGQLSTNCKSCTSRINKERSIIRQTVGVDIPVTKTCRGCHLEKPADAFYRNKGAPDGLFARCKDCTTEKRHKNMVDEPTVTHKVCRRCRIDKPASEFARNRSIKDGLYSWCRACDSLKSMGRQSTRGMGPVVATKECGQCRMELASARFFRDPNTIDGLSKRCKNCIGNGSATDTPEAAEAPATLLLGGLPPRLLEACPAPTAPASQGAPTATGSFVEAAMRVLGATSQAPASRPMTTFAPLKVLMGVPMLPAQATVGDPSLADCGVAELLPIDVKLELLPPE